MRLLSLFAVLGLVVAVGVPALAEKPPTDDELHDRVMQRLASDRDVKGGGLEVDVKDGVVTLRGTVREQKQKDKAERITKKVRGVKQVVNEIKVEFGSHPHSAQPPQ
jgi:hypothetical protein